MKYLKHVLGIDVTYYEGSIAHLPNFISFRYEVKKVSLDGIRAVFVYPKSELEQVAALKKQLNKMHEIVDVPVVLILDKLTSRFKEYLLREKIAFVVDKKQIYLPFLAVYLQERGDAPKLNREEILPSAQMLLLYFIYEGGRELTTIKAAKDLELTPTSISRASKQLEDFGLLKSKRAGVLKILYFEGAPNDLFCKAQNYLVNPVKRTVYIPKEKLGTDLLKSGYSALSDLSELNAPKVECYASVSISSFKDCMTYNLIDANYQVAVQMWRYDPRKLSKTNTVDELSLALSLKDDADERVEVAVDNMLNNALERIYD